MVPSTTAAVGRCPNSSPRGQGHSEDAGNTAKISQCSLPQVNCMDIIKQRCQKEGFSEKLPIWSPEVDANPHSESILHVLDNTTSGVMMDRFVQIRLL